MANRTLTQILVDSQRPETQKQAEELLKTYETSNYPEFLGALALELCDPSKPALACRMAGIILKNALQDTRNEKQQLMKAQIWYSLHDGLKKHVKDCALKGLLSPIEDARKSSSQVIAALGVLELAKNSWDDLIPTLYANATSTQLSDEVKIATLEAAGFLCEALEPSLVTEQATNMLLSAIVGNMRENKIDALRKASTTALYNTLIFANANMQKKVERDVIIQNICIASVAERIVDMRCTAFACMALLAEHYYELLPNYMDAFFKLTFQAIKKDEEKVALNAIEFWSTLCEYENRKPPAQTSRYIAGALDHLLELITSSCLIKQREDLGEGEDEWNIVMAGACLLRFMAENVKDVIVPKIIGYVSRNIADKNWRNREASLVAFGNILFGPQAGVLDPYIADSILHIAILLDQDTSPQVCESAAWLLGEFFESSMRVCKPKLSNVMEIVLRKLERGKPNIAFQCATMIHKIGMGLVLIGEEQGQTNVLSPFMIQTLTVLAGAASRPDWDAYNLRSSCFEAMNSWVACSADDQLMVIVELLQMILQKLEFSLNVVVTSSTMKDEVEQMIQSCCATLTTICQRAHERALPRVDSIMQLILRVITTHSTSNALSDAFLIVGQIGNIMNNATFFTQYLPLVLPHAMRALQNCGEYEVCISAAGLMSDLFCMQGGDPAQGINIPPDVVKEIIRILLQNLANVEANRDVKPPCIVALGDIGMAMKGYFAPFIEPVLAVLANASHVTCVDDDEDMNDFVNKLRDAVLEAYTGLLIGSQGQEFGTSMFIGRGRLDDILSLFVLIANDIEMEKKIGHRLVNLSVVLSAISLTGEICVNLRSPGRDRIVSIRKHVDIIFNHMKTNSRGQDDAETIKWAMQQFR